METKKAYKAPSTELVCPICGTGLVKQDGDQVHPGDSKFGVGLYCPGAHPSVCSAQEVFGHGSNIKEALGVIQDKYKKE